MKTKSGRLYLNKTEIKEFVALIQHSEQDMSYEAEGTFGLNPGTGDGKIDMKELKKVKNAISALNWILENAIN